MTAIPTENQRHVREIARDTLPENARPDFRPRNRWYCIELDDWEAASKDDLADALRAAGYKTSVVGHTVKATKRDLEWPETDG